MTKTMADAIAEYQSRGDWNVGDVHQTADGAVWKMYPFGWVRIA